MQKSMIVHYKNKYPGSRVSSDDSKLDVYSADGDHLVALRKNGAGQWLDQSEELGCFEKHNPAPIPRAARVHKLFADGKIGLDEESKKRVEDRKEFLDLSAGYSKIHSCESYEKKGYKFSEKGDCLKSPAAQE